MVGYKRSPYILLQRMVKTNEIKEIKKNKKKQYNKTKPKQSNIPHPQNSCKVPSIHHQMYTPHQHVYECSLLYFGTCASIKSGRFKIFFYFINCFLNIYFYMIIIFTIFFILDAEFFRSTFISHYIVIFSKFTHTNAFIL